MKKIITFILCSLALLLIWGAWRAHQSGQFKQTKITNVGSTALQPLTEAAIPGFLKNHPQVSLTVQGGGSGTGLSQVQAGAVDLGSSDVFAEQKNGIKANQLKDHIIAVAGIVPIVNPKLPVTDLTANQLQEIFTGKIKNWQVAGGPDQPITVINRAEGSGTRVAFEQVILKGKKAMVTQEQDSNGTVKQIVANTPGAISYVALPYVNKTVKALKLDGITANAQNITTNQWPLWSYEHMYTKKHANPVAKQFITYMQSPAVQEKLVKKAHYVSVHEMKVQRDAKGKVTSIKEAK